MVNLPYFYKTLQYLWLTDIIRERIDVVKWRLKGRMALFQTVTLHFSPMEPLIWQQDRLALQMEAYTSFMSEVVEWQRKPISV